MLPPQIDQPSLPAYCTPDDEFLEAISITFYTCIPSYLALLSTVLGTCSIISWLFAQLPQIYKNYQLKSTSGLSVYFLTEWLLGDVTNLLGCLFTGQAQWQIIIAGYYVLVDCGLTGQWVWYELLHHGRPLRPIWGRWRSGENDGGSGASGTSGMQQVPKGKAPDAEAPNDKKDIEVQHSAPVDAFRIPNFARSPSGVKESYQVSPMGRPQLLDSSGTHSDRNIRRVGAPSSPLASPKTLLYISMIFAVISHSTLAHPTSTLTLSPLPLSVPASTALQPTTRDLLGKFFSWSSTFLYLFSRLPQLYKNHIRRSTAGLSPTLFAAAFFGNLFYSASLLTNPCAWSSFPPGSSWVPEGSTRRVWILRALPFFLGAAGVLIMDAAVGFQFLYFGDGELRSARGRPLLRDDAVLVTTLDGDGVSKTRRLYWRRASGWMRGWAPAVSVAGTPSTSRATTPRNVSPASQRTESQGSVEAGRRGSQSIPIRGAGGALDEARALLGTGRHASPRSYGALSSPR